MPTLTITNLGGPLTRKNDGDINSGLAKFDTSHGYNPFVRPGNLTWNEQPVSILTLTPSNSSVATIYNMKFRDLAGVSLVYAIGGVSTDPKLYRILVANNSTPNVDSPSVLAAFTGNVQFPTGMVFYGETEKIFYGSSTQIEKINFDGSGRSVLGNLATSSLISGPRPMALFLGKIYFGNTSNIGEIDSTEAVVTTNKLSPALPSGLYVADLDPTPDGNYLQITATRTIPQITSGTGSTFPSRSTNDSYKFLWNGIDDGISAYESFTGVTMFASEVFGEHNYTTGRDVGGAFIADQREKFSLPNAKENTPQATYSIGETFGTVLPEYDTADGVYKTVIYHHGRWDNETPSGLYRMLRQNPASLSDVKFAVAAIPVTSFGQTPTIASFVGQVSSAGKMYYSTSEVDSITISSMAHRLWRFPLVPDGLGSIVAGVYETQSQLFSKKVKVSEVRVYTDPLAGGNDFEVHIIGSGGSVLSGASAKFAVGSNVTAGTDMVQFNPQAAPTYAVGVRITNASVTGVRNWTGSKVEIDFEDAGK